MDNNSIHINDTLLVKFLLGETDSDEQQLVIDCLEDNPEIEKRLDNLEKIWLETGNLTPRPIPVDTNRAWEKTAKRIDRKSVGMRIRVISTAVVAVAASLIMIFSIFRGSDSDLADTEPQLFANNTEQVVGDSLPDGSHICLNKGGSVKYIHHRSQRRVEMSGEVFFNVKRDTNRPFVITAGMGEIRVLGTSFNVNRKDNKCITIDVNSGRVKIYLKDDEDTYIILTKGESGLISYTDRVVRKINPNPSAFFWMDKRLIFKEQSLGNVFRILQDCYHTDIISDNDKINDYKLTASFREDTAEQVLEVIASIFQIQYIVQDGTIIIKPKDKK